MEKIIVIGGGGHAKVVISLLKRMASYSILGYLDEHDNGRILNVPCLGKDDQLGKIKADHPGCAAVIGVGNTEVSHKRRVIRDNLRRYGFLLPAVVSPSAVINEDVKIAAGTVVMDGVVINAGTHIGECSIVNTKSSIDHDCQIGDFVHVAPGVTICGGVKIGRNSLIGAGATVIQYKTIADDCLVAAGSTVISDVLQTGVYAGIPARRIR